MGYESAGWYVTASHSCCERIWADGYMYKGDQFLAVSIMNQSKEKNPDQTEDPPALARRPSKSAIQIWGFPVLTKNQLRLLLILRWS